MIINTALMPKIRETRLLLSCPATGCPFFSYTPGSLNAHRVGGHCERLRKLRKRKNKITLDEAQRDFPCPFKDCTYKAFRADTLRTHEIKEHPYIPRFWCRICHNPFDTLQSLAVHINIEKHFACYVDGCPFTTRRLDHLELHTRRHQNDRRFSCGTCPYKAFTTSDMVVHESTHLNNKPFACHLEWCKQSFAQSNQLTMHKKNHTIEGQIRKKKQENRVNNKLKEWGFTVDCETIINAVAGECLKDAQRYFSRLDFRIVNCINAICILEVDEFQHYNYNLSCEASRMADVRASLVLAGYTLPIHWNRVKRDQDSAANTGTGAEGPSR